MNDISVIIVHYGHGDEVFKCLENLSLIHNRLSDIEFILVDNNEDSADKTKITKRFKWLKYYSAKKNLGWGGGRNFGVKQTSGEFLFFLDSDILINTTSFLGLYKFIKNDKKVGLISPLLKNKSGKFFANVSLDLTPIRGIFYLSLINKYFPKAKVIKDYLMSSWKRNTTKKVDVAELAAFFIRKSALDAIGGFDENIFLYFEENDVALSLKKKTWEIYFYPKATVIHLESKGTPKSSEEIKKVFRHSRFYYFKKHYGIISALIVEFFAQLSKESFGVLTIFVLGTFLRFYQLYPNIVINGEMGTDYMNVWNMVHGNRTFLIGPRTSHEWFFIPPIAYWIYAILLTAGKYNPIVINLFWGVIGSLSILICYYYVKKLFNERVALVSSFFIATSPIWIYFTRAARYNAPAAILFFPYLWYLSESIKDKGKSLFKLGLVLGFMMSFFPSPILLIPAAVVSLLFYKIKPSLKNITTTFFGFLIPNITFIVYEITHKFEITIQLISWVPYRILGFFGVYHKNTFNSEVLSQNLYSIYRFFYKSFAYESFILTPNIISLSLFFLFLIGLLVYTKKMLTDRKLNMSFILLLIIFIVSYLGLFIHGDPPEHYYLVILPIPIVLAAYFLVNIFKNDFALIVLTIVIGSFGVSNLISSNWFYVYKNPIDYEKSLPLLSAQNEVVDFIVTDSKGSEFSVARIGLNDKFDNNFANNYIYSLTVGGARVVNESRVKYTIIESLNLNIDSAQYGSEVWRGSGIKIYKNTK